MAVWLNGGAGVFPFTNRIAEKGPRPKPSRFTSQLYLLRFGIGAPINFRVESTTSTTTSLTWDNIHGPEATGIEIYRALGQGSFSLIDTIAITRTSYLDTALTLATLYRYKLQITNV